MEAFEGQIPLGEMNAAIRDSLAQLASYCRETPDESRRFVKNETEFQAMSKKMAGREARLKALVSAPGELWKAEGH